jgi:pSer/pThr/pTyr-binding forkhead associated (FHA) protein
MQQDQITIIEPNGVERTRPITPAGLTIGRGHDNTLALGYDLVSRYHAQVTFEGGRYYVTDLNSANGSYLGKNRLTPNMPTVWKPGQPLRVGEVVIQLQQVVQPHQAALDAGETVIGQLPDDTFFRSGAKSQPGQYQAMIWVVMAVILLCLLLSLGGSIYYYYFIAG